jgi:Bicoid-interacting protein 3 (Bin3)
MQKNYNRIKLKPELFPTFLVNLGLVLDHTYQGGKDVTKAKGFQRPIYLFRKP